VLKGTTVVSGCLEGEQRPANATLNTGVLDTADKPLKTLAIVLE
jgi:hypothetical protein